MRDRYHYIDGQLLPTATEHSPVEAQTEPADREYHASGVVAPAAQSATATLQILSVAMGVSNGGVGPRSVKGLQSVKVNGMDITNGTWDHAWMMPGETKEVWTEAGSQSVTWAPATTADNNSTLSWFKSTFDLPSDEAVGAGAEPQQVSYAMSMLGANKGVVFVNGFELGRYWLTPGQCNGVCAPPIKNGHCYMHWDSCGKPTQELYHIPTPVLKPKGNLVVVFEETATVQGVAMRDLEKVEMVKLTAHP